MKKRLKILSGIILLWSYIPNSYSQDFPYSQFYANPVYLNPALAGLEYCPRVIINYRNQWPSLPEAFVSYSASYDQFSEFLNGGVGVQLEYSGEGQATISNFHLRGMYAYKLRLGRETEAQLALEAGLGQRSISWENLLFSSMIDPANNGNPSPLPPPENFNGNIIYPDFATGFVVGFSEKYFFGAAAHHLSQPETGFLSERSNPLKMKITIHAGAEFGEESSGFYRRRSPSIIISPNILYQQQGDFRHLNMGSYFNFSPFIVGLWFRYAFENTDAVIISLGLQRENLRFGYSFDYTVSSLSVAGGGAHEVSLAWLFNCSEKRKRPKAIKCPSF
jgi:type IX secretion system PorP/SprF family membrane protein